MSILKNSFKRVLILSVAQALAIMPAVALDLESTVTDSNRSNYVKQTTSQVIQNSQQKSADTKIDIKNIKTAEPKTEQPTINKPVTTQTQNAGSPVVNEIQKTVDTKPQMPAPTIEKPQLPTVPNLPAKAQSSSVAPINNQYSGKLPSSDAIEQLNIRVGNLIIDESVVKSKGVIAENKNSNIKQVSNKTSKQTTKVKQTANYRTASIAKGMQLRVVNQTKITDSLYEGQNIIFTTTQELKTPYFTVPRGTKITAKVVDSHKPQMTCNGGLVAIRFVSLEYKGYSQPINAGIIKQKTDNIHFSNLKGKHTYIKTTCKKAKWGQNMYSKWSKTAHKLANNGAGVIVAPFPYIGGCVLACASTVSSPVTALLGKGGNLVVPANTVFTLKFYDTAKIRY